MTLNATTLRRRSPLPTLLLTASLILGCGAQEDGTQAVTSALSGGAAYVSEGQVPNSVAEHESAQTWLWNTPRAVAYRTEIISLPGYRCSESQVWVTFPGATTVSRGLDNFTDVLVGNPSIDSWNPGGTLDYQYFVSATAHSNASWFSRSAPAYYGCVPISKATFPPDEVCVATVNLQRSNFYPYLQNEKCWHVSGTPAGTAISALRGVPYVAVWDSNSSIAFYRGDGTQLASPLWGINVRGYPIFTKNTSLDLFAPDANGTFWETSYSPSTNTWSTPSAVGSGFQWGAALPYGISSTREYSAAYVPGSAGPGATYLFYRTGSSIVGWSRGSSGGSAWSRVFTTPAGVNAFHPAAAVSTIINQYNPYSGYHLFLSYWDNTGPNGSAKLQYSKDLASPFSPGSETPCPYNGYWGGYDEIYGFTRTAPAVSSASRTFTDSTAACQTPTGSDWSSATPQHISEIEVDW